MEGTQHTALQCNGNTYSSISIHAGSTTTQIRTFPLPAGILSSPLITRRSVTVSIAAFQAAGLGSTPGGELNIFFVPQGEHILANKTNFQGKSDGRCEISSGISSATPVSFYQMRKRTSGVVFQIATTCSCRDGACVAWLRLCYPMVTCIKVLLLSSMQYVNKKFQVELLC
jgi:hypothetical protein